MKRMIGSLVLLGSVALAAGCNRTVSQAPRAWQVVERKAADCLEAGYDRVVCDCALQHMANAIEYQGYVPLQDPGTTGRAWPGEDGGVLARAHASCQMWAAVLGLLEPHVAAGPPN